MSTSDLLDSSSPGWVLEEYASLGVIDYKLLREDFVGCQGPRVDGYSDRENIDRWISLGVSIVVEDWKSLGGASACLEDIVIGSSVVFLLTDLQVETR